MEALNKAMPDTGFDWTKTVGSGPFMLCDVTVYPALLDALAVRWAVGDTSQLQPAKAATGWYAIALLMNMVKTKAGQEEIKLLGRSGAVMDVDGTSMSSRLLAESGGRSRDETLT